MWSKGSVMFTKDDNGGCGFEKSKYPKIYEVNACLCLWLSQPSQSNAAQLKRNRIVLTIAEYLHIKTSLRGLKGKGFLKEERSQRSSFL